jgi:hypothetical protein
MKKILFFSLLSTFAFSSCESDTNPSDIDVNSYTDGVFILNEGNFQGGNASLSFYNKLNDTLTNDVFTAVNNIPLGDVVNSMTTRGDRGYIIVNNSGKIEAVSLNNLASLGTLSGLTSPRYMAFASNTKAYVTDLYSNAITIFNPETMTASGSIPTNGWTEEILVYNGSAFVAGSGSDHLYRINTTTDAITDSIYIGEEPGSLALDANGKLWVLTTGGYLIEEPKLVRINPADLTIELSLTFPSVQSYPGNLFTNAAGDRLFFLDGAIYTMDISATSLPSTPLVNGYFYKIGIDRSQNMIYASDPLDYNSSGKVYRYSITGLAQDTLEVGVIPGNFCFTGL